VDHLQELLPGQRRFEAQPSRLRHLDGAAQTLDPHRHPGLDLGAALGQQDRVALRLQRHPFLDGVPQRFLQAERRLVRADPAYVGKRCHLRVDPRRHRDDEGVIGQEPKHLAANGGDRLPEFRQRGGHELHQVEPIVRPGAQRRINRRGAVEERVEGVLTHADLVGGGTHPPAQPDARLADGVELLVLAGRELLLPQVELKGAAGHLDGAQFVHRVGRGVESLTVGKNQPRLRSLGLQKSGQDQSRRDQQPKPEAPPATGGPVPSCRSDGVCHGLCLLVAVSDSRR